MKGYVFRPATNAEQEDNRFPRCPDATHVLEVNGDVVCHALAYPGKKLLTIKMLQTRPDVERRGYGRYFAFMLEDLARKLDASRVEAWDAGDDTKEFWRKCGYRYDRDENDVEIWSRKLNPLRIWIPVAGYYANFKALPPEEKNYKGAAIHTVFLLAFFVVAFIIRFSPMIPVGIALFYAGLFDINLLFVILASSAIETGIVSRSTNPGNWFFRHLGWSRLVGQRTGYVLFAFLYFNYQEIMFGVVGLTFVFLIHAVL